MRTTGFGFIIQLFIGYYLSSNHYAILESQRPSLEQNILSEGRGHGKAWFSTGRGVGESQTGRFGELGRMRIQNRRVGCVTLLCLGVKLPSPKWDLTGGAPDQPMLVNLVLVPGPQVPTKSYFRASPKLPCLSQKLIKNKVSFHQVAS